MSVLSDSSDQATELRWPSGLPTSIHVGRWSTVHEEEQSGLLVQSHGLGRLGSGKFILKTF